MHPPGADTVLLRHGEIGTKSRQVQHRMEGRLRDNVAAILADRGFDDPVERQHMRLFVRTRPGRIEAVTDAATDAFGVVSASPAASTEPTLGAICRTLAETASEGYEAGTFAVRARRAGNVDHAFRSTDIEREGGAAVWEAAEGAGIDPAVDLDDPDLTLFVECRREEAFVFVEKREGPGGLPVGTQEPLVALVSGGFDSPVAAWEAMRRGCPIYPLYVDLGEYGGPDHRARAERAVARLGRYAPNFDLGLTVAPGGDAVARLVEEMDTGRMLGLRRFMYRVAERVATEAGAVGIVSGEAIGQKSSQTAANLRVTGAVTDLPIHRPLLTADKTAIIQCAREIGTHEEATIPVGCNRVAPANPATRGSFDTIEDAEPDDIERLADDAAERASAIGPEAPAG
ncbi:MAG: tRNA sulfurtransferase [Haloarculaceae archaeon]